MSAGEPKDTGAGGGSQSAGRVQTWGSAGQDAARGFRQGSHDPSLPPPYSANPGYGQGVLGDQSFHTPFSPVDRGHPGYATSQGLDGVLRGDQRGRRVNFRQEGQGGGQDTQFDDDQEDVGGVKIYQSPQSDQRKIINEISEITNDIEKEENKKNKSLKFLVFGVICSALLAVGLFTSYGPQGFSAMESLRDAKGGAFGLETAQLAFGFSGLGFAIPILMTCVAIFVGLSSSNKINKMKYQKAILNEMKSGVRSNDPKIQHDPQVQIDQAKNTVDALNGLRNPSATPLNVCSMVRQKKQK